MQKFIIRRADGFADKLELDALQRACLPGDKPYDVERGHWWMAWRGKLPVAFGGLTETANPKGWGYLCRSGVLSSARGHGLQARLIRARVVFARRHGLSAVITDTANNNHASSNSLIRCGFKLYEPEQRWGLPGGLHWRLAL